MKALAEALALAVAHLSSVNRANDDDSDDDCKTLESIADILSRAGPEVLALLKFSAEDAITILSKATPPNLELIQGYQDLIEHISEASE